MAGSALAKAGPKGALQALPAPAWDAWTGTRSERARRFIETYLYVPKGHNARKRFKLAPCQLELLELFLDGDVRAGIVSIPRGNGKTTLCAALALFGLFGDGVEGAQVLIVSTAERTARHTFDI